MVVAVATAAAQTVHGEGHQKPLLAVVLAGASVYDCARFAGIAQLVEQRIRNAQVMGSSPFTGSIFTLIFLPRCGGVFCARFSSALPFLPIPLTSSLYAYACSSYRLYVVFRDNDVNLLFVECCIHTIQR